MTWFFFLVSKNWENPQMMFSFHSLKELIFCNNRFNKKLDGPYILLLFLVVELCRNLHLTKTFTIKQNAQKAMIQETKIRKTFWKNCINRMY